MSNQEIQTIKTLKEKGVSISFISKLLHAEGLAVSTAYYHLSDNRDAYDNNAKVIRARQRENIQAKVARLIEKGWTTGQIARDWNIELGVLNKIYIS